MGRTPTYMGPNEYDASKERRALNHLLQEKLSRAQTAGNWARCWCILARILTRGLTVKFQGSVSASEPRAAGRSDTRSILCRYASVQRMREVAGEFVAVELDSRHSADVYPECARVCVCICLCLCTEEEGAAQKARGIASIVKRRRVWKYHRMCDPHVCAPGKCFEYNAADNEDVFDACDSLSICLSLPPR